jgi:UDP-N-acetylmuramoyl-tripeptide--D-alanyl-D-alanine ligase
MEMLLYILVFAVFSFGIYIEDKKQLHMAQLEGYKPKQYWWWIKHNSKTLFRREVLVVIAALAIYVLVNISGYSMMFGIIGTVAYAAVKGCLIYQSMNRKVKAKKPLVFTHRATRLFAAALY